MGLVHSQNEENIIIAKELLSLGIDVEQICQVTKLTKEEVLNLANNNS